MLRHYFTIGLRSLMRERLNTVINLVGLGLGMACALLISLPIANVAAWPAAWYVAQRWLDSFAYRISLSIWPFVLAAVVTLIIVILTVSAQAVRAVLTNPVEALHYE